MTKNKNITAPFSDEELERLQTSQKKVGLLTCQTPDYCENKGIATDNRLIPTKNGLVCKCGKMPTQTWAPLQNLEDIKMGIDAFQERAKNAKP